MDDDVFGQRKVAFNLNAPSTNTHTHRRRVSGTAILCMQIKIALRVSLRCLWSSFLFWFYFFHSVLLWFVKSKIIFKLAELQPNSVSALHLANVAIFFFYQEFSGIVLLHCKDGWLCETNTSAVIARRKLRRKTIEMAKKIKGIWSKWIRDANSNMWTEWGTMNELVVNSKKSWSFDSK